MTDEENEAETKMRRGRAKRQGEERDRGATNDWLQESFSYEKRKIKRKKKKTGTKLSLKKSKKATQKEE